MSYQASASRYESMPYVRCGRSGLLLPRLALGLWHNFGEPDDDKVSRELLFRAFDLGITHFDLANNYGPPPGAAESFFGSILKHEFSQYRDEMIISTKAGYRMWPGPYGEWGSRKYLISSLDQSLLRMGLDYVDIFYSHRPDPDTPLEETCAALADIVRQGKALYVGISSYTAEQTARAADLLQQMGVPCLIHQPSYNIFDRWIEPKLLATLADRGIGCAVFCPLAQGLLTNRYIKGVPGESRAAKAYGFLQTDTVNEKLPLISKLHAMACVRGQTLSQMALAWVLRRPEITSALIGASSVAQLEENVKCLEQLEFSEDELAAIEEIALSSTMSAQG
jgi:L-glyceraldehyde 3-phosphate reductase